MGLSKLDEDWSSSKSSTTVTKKYKILFNKLSLFSLSNNLSSVYLD